MGGTWISRSVPPPDLQGLPVSNWCVSHFPIVYCRTLASWLEAKSRIAFFMSIDILTRIHIMNMIMRVSKWGNSLAVRLPKSLVDDLGLKPGDELEVVSAKPSGIVVARDERGEKAVKRMRERALSLPEGHSFDRDEANAR